jgi:hypothetical protein
MLYSCSSQTSLNSTLKKVGKEVEKLKAAHVKGVAEVRCSFMSDWEFEGEVICKTC